VQGASKQVSSSQTGVHPRLPALLARHRRSAWRKPPQAVDGPALARLDAALADSQRPLILDSFCGTGMSSAILAQRYPQALVVGVDQSAHRLRRAPPQPRNCLLLQAHCEAVWRHLAERGISLHSHYLLYPNPWPKAAQLGRRVHGHPAFPLLLKLGGRLELRSNWQVYPEEFGLALHLLGVSSLIATLPAQNEPLTLFERKYRDSGHDLWVLKARLPGGDSQSSALYPQGERKEKHHDARN
jgi:tRNA G46 methylase TrmB